jgi:hypothetical protein
MFVFIKASPYMFRSDDDHPQGFMYPRHSYWNVVGCSPDFTPSMWLYFCLRCCPVPCALPLQRQGTHIYINKYTYIYMALGPDVDRPCFRVRNDCTTVEGAAVYTNTYDITSRKTIILLETDILIPAPWGRVGGVNANLHLFSASLLCIWAVSFIHGSL